MNTDPLGKALEAIPTDDAISEAPSFWAQAVLIYWWDQISINLTSANADNFNSSLQAVLLQGMINYAFLSNVSIVSKRY